MTTVQWNKDKRNWFFVIGKRHVSIEPFRYFYNGKSTDIKTLQQYNRVRKIM